MLSNLSAMATSELIVPSCSLFFSETYFIHSFVQQNRCILFKYISTFNSSSFLLKQAKVLLMTFKGNATNQFGRE